ncbi:MAG: hypothetical protein IPO67_13815 [Deltaproteobacteria bacterium]|nr:hypothetical protein [Deltaproteobacteria bacterium]
MEPAAEVEPAEARPVPLPLFRFGWALVIDGLADAARAPALASALGQDLATARLHAVSAHPKVVQRGDDEAALTARAERLRAEGIATSVLHRSMVQRLGRPAWRAPSSGAARCWGSTAAPSGRVTRRRCGRREGRLGRGLSRSWACSAR